MPNDTLIIIPTRLYRMDLLYGLTSTLKRGGYDPVVILDRIDKSSARELGVRIAQSNEGGFSGAVNVGLAHLRNESYVVVLNDDILIAEDTIQRLIAGLKEYDIVAPVSNAVGGIQARFQSASPAEFRQIDDGIRGNTVITLTSFISGFAFAMRKEVARIGFDPEIPLLWSDNDFCWRATLAGFRMGILENVFIYHYGSQTLSGTKYPVGQDFLRYAEKATEIRDQRVPDKVVGVMRVKNGMKFLPITLPRILKVVDEMVVADNGSQDGTREYLESCGVRVLDDNLTNEAEARTRLDKAAIEMGAGWVFSFDADECPEERLTRDVVRGLVRNEIFPEVSYYLVRILNF